ncbi:unnamed protein product, partial [marine sediment metagenome]
PIETGEKGTTPCLLSALDYTGSRARGQQGEQEQNLSPEYIREGQCVGQT